MTFPEQGQSNPEEPPAGWSFFDGIADFIATNDMEGLSQFAAFADSMPEGPLASLLKGTILNTQAQLATPGVTAEDVIHYVRAVEFNFDKITRLPEE